MSHQTQKSQTNRQSNSIQEGLAVASIARDVVVKMTPPATTMRGKFGSGFET